MRVDFRTLSQAERCLSISKDNLVCAFAGLASV